MRTFSKTTMSFGRKWGKVGIGGADILHCQQLDTVSRCANCSIKDVQMVSYLLAK